MHMVFDLQIERFSPSQVKVTSACTNPLLSTEKDKVFPKTLSCPLSLVLMYSMISQRRSFNTSKCNNDSFLFIYFLIAIFISGWPLASLSKIFSWAFRETILLHTYNSLAYIIFKLHNYNIKYNWYKEVWEQTQLTGGKQVTTDMARTELADSLLNHNDSFLKVRNGSESTSPLLGKYCGTLLPNPIFSQSRDLYLRFKSDSATSGRGYEIIWTSSPSGKTMALWKGK